MSFEYVLVTSQNSLIARTQNYACEKKWYTFSALRPQKAALKAYNSISFHNTLYRENDENYVTIEPKDLQKDIEPRFKYDVLYLKEYKDKLEKVVRKPKNLVLYVRNMKTNKLYGYEIETLINFYPNQHELKNKIIFKTKAKKCIILQHTQDYIKYL